MNIAELFVRVRGDVSDVDRQMGRVQQSLNRVDNAARSTHLSTGRLGNQFANLAGRIAGVHPIVGNLAQVMGNFAIGGAVTVAVLGGLALIAVAYDKLTDSSRKAMEQSDKLIDSLLRSARIRALGVGGESKAAMEDLAKGTAEHGKRAEFFQMLSGLTGGGTSGIGALFGSFAGKHTEKVTQGAKAMQEAVNQLGLAIGIANDKIVAEAESAANKLQAAADKARRAREADAAEELTLQKQISDLKLKIILEELQKIAALHAEILGQTKFTGMPNISMPFEGLTDKQKDTLKQLGVLTEDANKNATAIQGAVMQSAQIIAGTVAQALNIGGGGKGSAIAGSIGAVVGAAAGSFLGPPGAIITSALGSAVGGVIGGLAGSLFGGLFDSDTKATNANTAATLANTAALMQNAPSVYKVARGRFDATEVKDFRRATVRYNTRGGAPVMVVP